MEAQLNASEKLPVTAEATMPVPHGQLSSTVAPAVSAPVKNSFVAAAAPVVAQSFSVTLPATMQVKRTQRPGFAFITCAAVMLMAELIPPGKPLATFTGLTIVAGMCYLLLEMKNAGYGVEVVLNVHHLPAVGVLLSRGTKPTNPRPRDGYISAGD